MNLIQFLKSDGKRAVGVIDGGKAHIVKNATSVHALALKAASSGVKLKALIKDKGLGKAIDPAALLAENRLLPPIDHEIRRTSTSPAPASRIWAPPRRATPCTNPISRRPKRRSPIR